MNTFSMRAVIFDMDGVLVETDHLFEDFVCVFVKNMGAEPPQDVNRYRGVTSKDQWKAWKKELGLDKSVDVLVSEARQGYLTYLESRPDIKAVAGVVELIHKLTAANIKMAVASSANPVRITMLLKKLGLNRIFSATVSADDIKKGKPAPDCFLLAARRLGVRPEECLVIEDAARGIRAAKAAGMKSVGYKGDPKNFDNLDTSDWVVHDFHEVTVAKLKNL